MGVFVSPAADAQTTNDLGFPDPRYSTSKALAKFSCAGGRTNCPDGGEYAAAGGNLTITVLEMRNLPDLDGFGLAGLATDAYIEASIGDNVRRSGVIPNSLNPQWTPCRAPGCTDASDSRRDLNFGFRRAGTEITVRVMDEDSGFEFGDDLIAEVTLHAIYCSGFTAIKQPVVSANDSAWKLPTQPLCVEEIWIPLTADGACLTSGVVSDSTPCMRLRMTSLPFQMRTEQVFLPNVTVVGGMGGYFPSEDAWLYGRVYSASDTRLLSYFRMDRSKGGLLIRSDSASLNNKGNASLVGTYGYPPYARVTLNFDAEVFVFRRVDDAASAPEWLNSSFGWLETREYAQLKDVTGDFRAVAQNFSAHAINEYGDAFRHGIVTGVNVRQTYKDSVLSMYFILAAPRESFDVIPATYSKEFSRTVFVNVGLQFFPNFAFVIALVLRYLRRMNWRVERVQSFLAEKVIEDAAPPTLAKTTKGAKAAADKAKSLGQAKKSSIFSPNAEKKAASTVTGSSATPDVVAMLFLCYNESPDNIEFRRNVFYATCAIYLTMLMPLLFLLSWGVTTILLVTPPALGFGLIFLGGGALSTAYALVRWTRLGWRMTDAILRLFGLAFGSAFVFLFSATFADPRVFVGGEDLDFFSLTAIFLTLNMVPMIWIAFTNDSKLTKSLSQIVSAVGATKKVNAMKTKFKNLGSLGLKLATAKAAVADDVGGGGATDTAAGAHALKRSRKQSVFAPLMGDHYSVEQSIPGFRRADILNNAFVTPGDTRRQKNRKYYGFAVGILAVYCVVAGARSAYPAQAVGVAATVLLVDLCVFMLSRGFLSWSAGYIVFLLSSVRVCLAATAGDYWVLGHALLFMVFGSALCVEIIGKNLPRMNKQEAGGVTFFGHDHMQWRHLDLSTTPEFVLGFLSFFYVFLLLAVAFGSDAGDAIRVPVLGQRWPLWIFGVLAFVVVLFAGLSLATSRAFFLQKEQLLSEYATKVYLCARACRLPFMLAAASEVLVVCSGLFVFASTRSSFILVTSVFGPLILMLALAVYAQWRKNDHRLVIWPPEDDEEDVLDDDDQFDADDALEKEAEIMRETFVLPPLKGKGSTSIFDGADETFKMPALPPKSLLQGKLGALGAKPATGGAAPKSGPVGFARHLPNAPHLSKVDERANAAASDSPLTIVPDGERKPESSGALLAMAKQPHRGGRRFGFLRDLLARRVGVRALFSRQAWRKYKEAESLSPSSAGSPRGGSSQPLLGSPTAIGRRRSSATAAGGGSEEPEVDFATMSLYQAYQQGFLLPHDYATLGSFAALLALIFLYGATLSLTETPMWLGHVVWVAGYVVIFSVFPAVKFFRIAGVTSDMPVAFGGSYALAWVTGFVLFFHVLRADVNAVEALVVLSVLVFYPVFLLFVVTLLKWKDGGWELSRATKRVFAVCLAAIALWIFEMFVFVGVAFGAALAFLLALFLFVAFFLVKWVENDMYLAPAYQKRANAAIAGATGAAIAIGLLAGLNFFYCLSIVFVVLMLKHAAHFAASWFVGKADVAVFYSPYLFPVFSYNAYTNNVVDETRGLQHLYVVLLLGFLWGASGVVFFDPLGFGVGLCSLVLLVFAGVTAHLCAVTPVKMGIASKYVNEMILKDASVASKDVLEQRRQPFVLESAEFVELERRERKAELEFQAIAYGGAFAKKKTASAVDKPTDAVPASDEDASTPPRRSGGEIATEIDALERSCHVQLVDGREVPLLDGLITWRDVRREVFHLGAGPFGFLYALTLPWRLLQFLRRRYAPVRWRRPRVSQRGDGAEGDGSQSPPDDLLDAAERGSRRRRRPTDLVGVLTELPVLDEELDREFLEETRCVIHFQLLLLTAADARLGREQILFQQFLRENRFKLMSNGICPPAHVFRTSSFASLDIPLVAVWLLSLPPDARARFHALKAAFNDEMERLDAVVDAEDAQARAAQRELREFWRPHEEAQCRRRAHEFHARRMRREAEGVGPDELAGQDEALLNAREALLEIESGFSCVPGDFGRALQFVDREFPPDATSLAGCAHEREVAGAWKVSTAINVVAGLFDGGTDPDDVRGGRLNDAWLLSAISILAASGGVDDGQVDALVDRLFVTKQTSLTGAYALRLFKNCQWETVVVDDHFPVLADDALRASASAGAAFAHSRDFAELWVPLLEKAVAKYHGGYAALERGYVHQALEALTGCACDEIRLAQASRGSLKRTLWQQLLAFRRNKFLMGAGSIASAAADTEILDTGLVFGACYVVYDVRELDGHQLLRLRNPPGDHDEWKGDWSDRSRLWTRRLKKLLHWRADAADNAFWMHFDDFCHAFRSLYVCRYYDPARWPVVALDGEWRGATACGLPTRHNAGCALEGNPQFALAVHRPTEVLLSVTQVDARGLAPAAVLPVAVYVVAQGRQRDRAARVRRLARESVVAHSGEPVRQREVRVHCELEARTYTVLVAAYKKGMEGPFRVRVQSNYPVALEQLWPAAWKDPAKASAAEKLAARVKESVGESAAVARLREKKDALVSRLVAGAAVVDSALRDDAAVLRAELEKQQAAEAEAAAQKAGSTKKRAGDKPKPPQLWLEQWDESAGKPFYYNKQTGVSAWEKPPDF